MTLVLGLGPGCPGPRLASGVRPVAWGLLVAGAVFGIGGAWSLGRSRTIFPRPVPDARLVRSGVYGLVRHPLYTSLTLLAAGWSLVWASWPAGVAAVLQTLFLDRKARYEEKWLRQRFPEYADYAKRVRRLLPWVY